MWRDRCYGAKEGDNEGEEICVMRQGKEEKGGVNGDDLCYEAGSQKG